MRVSLDAPGPDSPLFSGPLSALGSASAFEALPATLFDGAGDLSAGVRTQFASLSFDPYATEVDPNATGITTLSFTTTSGAAIFVSELRTPVRFTLPALTSLADGTKAQCQYWNTSTLGYSTRGCVGIPDPRPRGHTFAWVPDFVSASDADMAAAWSLAGPLLDANCSLQILDCSVNDTRAIFANPADPFGNPGVACDGVSTSPKLVFVGSRCRLINAANEYGCSWDNAKQARHVPALA